MDKFIEKLILSAPQRTKYLKSNMDKFIVKSVFSVFVDVRIFKIQYG